MHDLSTYAPTSPFLWSSAHNCMDYKKWKEMRINKLLATTNKNTERKQMELLKLKISKTDKSLDKDVVVVFII